MNNDLKAQHTSAPVSNPSGEVQNMWSAELSLPSGWTFDLHNPVGSVERLMGFWNLEIWFDGDIVRSGAPLMADRPEAVESYLDAEPLTVSELLDEILLAAVGASVKVNPRVLKAATSKIIRRKRKQRKKELYARLTDAGKAVDSIFAEDSFRRVAELFDMPRELAIACLGHWIWQIKQKMLGRPVEHHMMLIVFSKEQGTGKSTFVRKLVEPLAEFASGDVLISDIEDGRSKDIFKFPVVVLDDMGQAAASGVPIIKSLVTGERFNRRAMGTSQSVTSRQAATFIGTANRPIHEMINDDSGHRRFVMMPFKKGDLAAGGNKLIWRIVNELNFEKLWLSVNAFKASPIHAYLTELQQFQKAFRPLPKVHQWILDLDLSSEVVRSITVRGGVRAEALRDLYVAQTGDEISNQKFSDEMLKATKDARMPFSGKQRKEVGALYIVRPIVDERVQRAATNGFNTHPVQGGLGCSKDPDEAAAPAPSGPRDLRESSGEMLIAPDKAWDLSLDAVDSVGLEY